VATVIPEPNQALQIIMGTLMMDVAPNMRDDYRQANVNLMAFAMMLVAQEYDRAAEVRVTENREMRALFTRAAEVVEDVDLRARLTDAAGESDGDLRISRLTATNNELRGLLIELHAAIEERKTPRALELARAIWSFLRSTTERRAIQIG
jgi:hypothetical protein